jgi:hypothetical protein
MCDLGRYGYEQEASPPGFFVSVASKGVRYCVSLLDATLMRSIASVAYKGLTDALFRRLESKNAPNR